MLVIAQLLSIVQHMDKIHFMDEGRILETEIREELMDMSGEYANMYYIQTGKYRIMNEEEADLKKWVVKIAKMVVNIVLFKRLCTVCVMNIRKISDTFLRGSGGLFV